MRRLLENGQNESGQAIVLVVALFSILFGMTALVLDVGSWFRTHRHLQLAVDAAALAGVQELPASTSNANTVAVSYANNNYVNTPTPTYQVTFPSSPSPCTPISCITVAGSTNASGFFTRIPLINRASVPVRATATAAVTVPSMMKNVAPVAVKNTSACAATNPGCYNQQVTLKFNESNVSSSTIGLINLTCHSTVSTACGSSAGIGGSTLKDWIENGYADALPSGQWYGVKTGETVGPVKQGFTDKIGVPLFFPVFDTVANDSQQNFYFHVIGWAAFVITSVDSWGPQGRQLTGHFVTYTTSDLPAGLPASSSSDFGVHVITLVQ
jgi:Flp pilus assembly protein TadG